MPGTVFSLEVNPQIPAKLARLSELANDLWYSWDRPTRELFFRLDPVLWDEVGQNPKRFLRQVEERRLQEAAQDRVFLESFFRVLSAYDTYMLEQLRPQGQPGLDQGDLVAYFCAEFGFHESFPIYSGGLGILAGDHCKAASDLGLPFVAMGLLYRQGYFSQFIDAEGNQVASYSDSDFENLPISPVLTPGGAEIKVGVELPGRTVTAKLWMARVGHITLYLLDTDLPENSEEDRYITHRLYGGDITMRIKQEMILGIGGVRALRAVGLKPSVWHINEGHAAFMIVERARELVSQGLDFNAALEATASATIFTTHTPVPAGHDIFPRELMLEYFGGQIQALGLDTERFLGLGLKSNEGFGFNQTALAVRGSRFQNGVSRIHGHVSSEMLADLWPQVPPEENPVSYVTNGVHVPTFLAQEWRDLFDSYLGGEWRNRLCDTDFWRRVEQIPDHLYWSVRQALKSQMINEVRERLTLQHRRNGGSEAHLDRLLRYLDPLDPSVLVVGFARRFATYKRATLLFEDLERLKAIVNHADRPVIFVFAGKAHPADRPGQELIRDIHRLAREPGFEGKIHMIEGYDMGLARALVYGVDVWLNNPEYPMEASGTSGEKAGINGTINLSVLDGWWGEGYNGQNGWAIKPVHNADPERARAEEAATLYELLENEVMPLYYQAGSYGFSSGWVKKSKHSMETLLPRYNAARMVGQYVRELYRPAAAHGRRVCGEEFRGARVLSQWKARVQSAWNGVSLSRLDHAQDRIRYGNALQLELAVELNGLQPDDVRVECILSQHFERRNLRLEKNYFLRHEGQTADGRHRFVLNLEPDACGRMDYRIRIYPYHELLAQAHETGLMIWL